MLPKLKVLIVDDFAIIRSGIKMMLNVQEQFDIEVFEAENGKTAIDLFMQVNPDITLLDIKMPVLNGLEALKEIKNKYTDAKVIALTSYSEKYIIDTMLNAGAMGYIIKDTDLDMLMEGINTVLRGDTFLCRLVTDVMKEEIFEGVDKKNILKVEKLNNTTADPFVLLTNRELEIIYHIVSGKSSAEIAKELHLSKRTIDSTRLRILGKLNIKSTAELVLYAVKNKLVKFK